VRRVPAITRVDMAQWSGFIPENARNAMVLEQDAKHGRARHERLHEPIRHGLAACQRVWIPLLRSVSTGASTVSQ
jgi:hypothetical protein